MPSSTQKRPRDAEKVGFRPPKKIRKFKKQLDYHSSSSDNSEDETTDFKAVNLQDSDDDEPVLASKKTKFIAEDEEQDGEVDVDEDREDAESDITGGDSDDSERSETSTVATSANGTKQQKKRNDPNAFATSISKILSSKLTTTKRSDPVLSRSVAALQTSKALADSKLEARARQKIRSERKSALEKGRVRDVLGADDEERSTQAIMEQERRLKKTAQRGVVKLFNAVREAQKRGEDAKRDALREGVVGVDKREEKVSEMSKQGFLDLIASGGSKMKA